MKPLNTEELVEVIVEGIVKDSIVEVENERSRMDIHPTSLMVEKENLATEINIEDKHLTKDASPTEVEELLHQKDIADGLLDISDLDKGDYHFTKEVSDEKKLSKQRLNSGARNIDTEVVFHGDFPKTSKDTKKLIK